MQHAEIFIKNKINDININKSDDFETITVRLDQRYGAMLKVMSNLFNFPISTSFTEIMSKHLFDMIVSLNDDDFKELNEKFKDKFEIKNQIQANAIALLLEKNIVRKYSIFDYI